MAGEKGLLVGRCEVAIVRNTLVEIVCDQIENVLLQIGSCANDAMDFSLANHLGERNAQLRRAHGACKCHKHDAALIQMAGVGFSRILESSSIEVAVVKVDELRNWAL